MVLSPFLIVLVGRDDGYTGIGWRRRCGRGSWWRGVGIGRGHGGAVGEALKDGHQTGDDEDDGPAATPGEDVERVQQEEDADQSNPDGAAKGAEETVLVAGSSVVCDAGAGVGHTANEEPDAKPDEEERDNA